MSALVVAGFAIAVGLPLLVIVASIWWGDSDGIVG